MPERRGNVFASLTSTDYEEFGVKAFDRRRALSQINRPQRDTAGAFGPKPTTRIGNERAMTCGSTA